MRIFTVTSTIGLDTWLCLAGLGHHHRSLSMTVARNTQAAGSTGPTALLLRTLIGLCRGSFVVALSGENSEMQAEIPASQNVAPKWRNTQQADYVVQLVGINQPI